MATPQGKHRQFYYQASENENDQVYDDDDILRPSPNKSLVWCHALVVEFRNFFSYFEQILPVLPTYLKLNYFKKQQKLILTFP